MHARDKQTATENDAKMFYPLGKNLEETQGRVATIPPPLYFRVLITTHNRFSCFNLKY